MRLSRGAAPIVAVVLGCAAVSLTACGGGSTTAGPDAGQNGGGGGGGGAAGQGNGTLTLAEVAVTPTWDSYKMDTGGFIQPEQAAYDTLIRQNPDGSYKPGLASAYKYTDPSTFVMTIRKGITFDDGTPFTAEAVVQNIKRAKTVTGPKTSALADVKSVTASGQDVTIKLAAPDPELPYYFSETLGMMMSPKALAHPESLTKTPSGVGPYVLDQARTVINSKYVFTRNPKFWDPSYTAGFKTMVFQVSSPSAILNGVVSGQYAGGAISYREIGAAKSAGLKVLSQNSFFMAVWTRDLKGPFGNPLVRQALNYAVDRKALQPLIGGGMPTATIFPPGTPAYNKAANDRYSYDPQKAKQLLAQAGYPNGISFTAVNTNYQFFDAYAQAIASQMAKAGIKVKIKDVSSAAYGAALFDPKVPNMFLYYNPTPGAFLDASTLFTRKGSFNFNHNKFPSIEALLKKAAAAPSTDEADKLYQQLAMETAEQAPLGAVTNFGEAYYAYNPKLVANMRFTVFQVYPFIGGLRPPAN